MGWIPMYADDLLFQFFRTIATGLGLKAVFGVSAGVALLGLVLACWKRLRAFGWGLLIAGASIAWIGFLTVSEVQQQETLSEFITARFYAYSDARRELAQAGLLVLPVLGVLVKLSRDKLERERRRMLLSTYLRIATKAYLDGDFDRAIAEFSIAIKVDPTRTEIFIRRGKAFAQKGQYDLAIADFDRATKLDIDLGPAYLNRGIVLAARGDHEDAIENFERALNLSPTDAAPMLHRGLSLVKLGMLNAAVRDFERVLRTTNHSDLTEPARFHRMMIENDLQSNELVAVGS
jgi:tetratricopeptide (TPR) repeat protein